MMHRTEIFVVGNDLYISMDVTDAPAGSRIDVTAYDVATAEPVWSESKEVSERLGRQDFIIVGGFPPGRYCARVRIDRGIVAERWFEITSRTRRSDRHARGSSTAVRAAGADSPAYSGAARSTAPAVTARRRS